MPQVIHNAIFKKKIKLKGGYQRLRDRKNGKLVFTGSRVSI